MKKLTHFNKDGRLKMVDVSRKKVVRREARARAVVRLSPETVNLIKENAVRKGDCLNAARVAGITAAKRTGELIPLCHPLEIDWADVDFELGKDKITIYSRVKLKARTGAEMEALTAAAVAALTLYDMLKAVDKKIVISEIKLIEKGKG